jgi:hypothetical protein
MRPARDTADPRATVCSPVCLTFHIITSNRSLDEWLGLFDDPILGNSALDRLANAAHQIVIERPSYRAKLAPKHRVVDHQPRVNRVAEC